jgi:hypothetical protein
MRYIHQGKSGKSADGHQTCLLEIILQLTLDSTLLALNLA